MPPALRPRRLPTLRVFLSYHHADQKLAGKIRGELETLGVVAFLAHQDINASHEWEDEILRELHRCHAFLPVLTKRFRRSKWTDQETGLAIGHGKVVLPLRVDMNPYGFASRFQAFRFRLGKALKKSCVALFKTLRADRRLRSRAINSLVYALGASTDFIDSRDKSALLLESSPLSKAQMNEALRVSDKNSQVYYSTPAVSNLGKLVRKHKARHMLLELNNLFRTSSQAASYARRR